MSSKKYYWSVVLGTLLGLFVLALPTIVVDPLFHYKAPKETYRLHNQRYQNDGIARHFEYDAVITGSSMTENFKTSEFDRLFGTDSVKLSYSGGYFSEVDALVNTALDSNNKIKIVLRSLDLNLLNMDKDSVRYDNIPTYLYDDNIANDVNYFLNKQIFLEETLELIELRKEHSEPTSFDEYSSWEAETTLAKELSEKEYPSEPERSDKKIFTDNDKRVVQANIRQNVIETAVENPDVTFYYFFTPYSCIYYSDWIKKGEWDYHIATQQCVIEELIEVENIKLFSFCDWYELTCDLERYKDTGHYNAEANSEMLKKIKAGEGLLTKDNYMEYLSNIKEYYLSLDTRKYYK